MSFRFVMAIVLVLGISYILWVRSRESKPVAPLPPPPVLTMSAPTPVLDEEQMQKIRDAANDSDSSVRWAAIELLYRMHDPQALTMLQKTLSLDFEPSVRKKALDMLKESAQKGSEGKPAAVQNLLIALKDQDREMRIAALMALGEVGDKSTVPQIADMVHDWDPEVRLQALHTLSQLQERKQAAYRQLTDELRKEYESAAQRAPKQNEERGINGIGNSGNQ